MTDLNQESTNQSASSPETENGSEKEDLDTTGLPSSVHTPPLTAHAWQETVSFIKTIVVLLLLAFFIRGTVVEAFKIPSGSMIPTLRIGDYILVSKLSYGIRLPFVDKILYQYAEPKRGDIVVFTRVDDPHTIHEDESKDNIIKRVIGLPGDEIEVQRNRLYVNKVLQDEDYARWQKGGDPLGNFGPEIVPEGHILLLGDNRDHSRDSRFWLNPFLPQERLKGKALFVYWSWDDLGRIGNVIK